MKVRELMQTQLLTVRPGDSWATAAQMMLWAGIRHLPVVEQGRLLGVISERDLLGLERRDRPVSEHLAGPVQSAHPDEDVVEIAARMGTSKLDCLPVVETGRLVGLLTSTDLLTHMVRDSLHTEPALGGLVHDVMTPDPDVTAFDDLLLDAVGRMNHRGIRHLPVVDGNRHVVGMLSDRDVRTAIGELMAHGDEKEMRVRVQVQRVADVARKSPITVREDAPLALAIRLLVDHRIGAVPVVDAQDRLVGIVSYLDILSATPGVGPAAARPGAERGAQPTRH